MNQLTISGFVGQTPKVVSFDTGNKVVKFSVAVKQYSSKTDKPATMWVNVDAWNGLGDRVLKCITAKREVIVYGRLAESTFISEEADGTPHKRTKPVIILTGFDVCGKKPEAEEAPVEKAPAKNPKMKLASA